MTATHLVKTFTGISLLLIASGCSFTPPEKRVRNSDDPSMEVADQRQRPARRLREKQRAQEARRRKRRAAAAARNTSSRSSRSVQSAGISSDQVARPERGLRAGRSSGGNMIVESIDTVRREASHGEEDRQAQAATTTRTSSARSRFGTAVVKIPPMPQLEERPSLYLYGPTRPQDSLADIAEAILPGDEVTVEEMMWSLVVKNPDAFVNQDITRLKPNVMLKVPKIEEIKWASRFNADRQIEKLRNGAKLVQVSN